MLTCKKSTICTKSGGLVNGCHWLRASATQTGTNRKDWDLGYEPQTEPSHWGHEIPTETVHSLLAKTHEPQVACWNQSRRWSVSSVASVRFWGKNRMLIFRISDLSANPAMQTLLFPFHGCRNRSCVKSGYSHSLRSAGSGNRGGGTYRRVVDACGHAEEKR